MMPRLKHPAVVFTITTLSLAFAAVLIAQPDGHRPPPPHEHRQAGSQRASNEPLPAPQVTITERDGYRYITSNGLPDHRPGRFPNQGNPNAISAQDYEYRVPLNPETLDEAIPMRGYLFGVALNGVPFDPGTAEIWTPEGRRMRGQAKDYGWNYDALSGRINLGLDAHHAHVQPTGAYHYHGLPTGLIQNQIKLKHDRAGGHAMTLIGYAADGFPMYAVYGHEDAGDADSAVVRLTSSYRLKEGTRPGGDDGPDWPYDGTFVEDWEYVQGAGDLDECNGRTGVTPEYPDGTYYYVVTDTYPFVPRVFRGTPDESFRKARPGGGPGGPGERGGRPPRR